MVKANKPWRHDVCVTNNYRCRAVVKTVIRGVTEINRTCGTYVRKASNFSTRAVAREPHTVTHDGKILTSLPFRTTLEFLRNDECGGTVCERDPVQTSDVTSSRIIRKSEKPGFGISNFNSLNTNFGFLIPKFAFVDIKIGNSNFRVHVVDFYILNEKIKFFVIKYKFMIY